MASRTVDHQTAEDMFFVIVEDTLSLQSYDGVGDNKPDTEGKRTIDGDSQSVDADFIDDLMSAIEDRNVGVGKTKQVDTVRRNDTKENVYKDMSHIPRLNGNINGGQRSDDCISIASHWSDQSFILVSPQSRKRSLEVVKIKPTDIDIVDVTSVELNVTTLSRDDNISIDELKMPGCPTPTSLEYDDDCWQMCRQSSQQSHDDDEPQKVLIRDLSYGSLIDVEETDPTSPVFLAINEGTNDNDVIMRRSRFIDELCSGIIEDDDITVSRGRSMSDLTQQSSKSYNYKKKTKQSSDSNKASDTVMKRTTSFDDFDAVLLTRNLSIKSHISFDDLHLPAITNNTMYKYDDKDLLVDPDKYIDEVYEEVEYMSHNGSLNGDVISFTIPSDGEGDVQEGDGEGDGWKFLESNELSFTSSVCSREEEELNVEGAANVKYFHEENNRNFRGNPKYDHGYNINLKGNPKAASTNRCGFLEYPYTESSPVGSPQKVRRLLSYNTSPDATPHIHPTGGVLRDRIIVNINGGEQRVIDMHLIEPYLKVLTHGGHHMVGDECRDIVVFAACFLPEKSTDKYSVIMEQLFFYCVHAVDLLVKESYEIVFFNSALESKNMPSRKWIKRYYDLIFYRLKKNLKEVYFVHQSVWLKAALRFSKLFISSKCRAKIHLVKNLKTLERFVPLEYVFVPPNINKVDETFQ